MEALLKHLHPILSPGGIIAGTKYSYTSNAPQYHPNYDAPGEKDADDDSRTGSYYHIPCAGNHTRSYYQYPHAVKGAIDDFCQEFNIDVSLTNLDKSKPLWLLRK